MTFNEVLPKFLEGEPIFIVSPSGCIFNYFRYNTNDIVEEILIIDYDYAIRKDFIYKQGDNIFNIRMLESNNWFIGMGNDPDLFDRPKILGRLNEKDNI